MTDPGEKYMKSLPWPAPLFMAETLATTAQREIAAMSEAATALEKLDADAQVRAATWLFDRYAAPRIAEAG